MLMSLYANRELSPHKALMERCLGKQRCSVSGTDLFFTTYYHATEIIKFQSEYYKEAIKSITRLHVKKQFVDVIYENIFYNKTFLDTNDKVLIPNQFCMNNFIYTYGHFLSKVERVNL